MISIDFPDGLEQYAFYLFNKFSHIYYASSEANWASIQAQNGNDNFTSASVTYNYSSEA